MHLFIHALSSNFSNQKHKDTHKVILTTKHN